MMTVLCDFSYGQKTTNKGDVLKKGSILGRGGSGKSVRFYCTVKVYI